MCACCNFYCSSKLVFVKISRMMISQMMIKLRFQEALLVSAGPSFASLHDNDEDNC